MICCSLANANRSATTLFSKRLLLFPHACTSPFASTSEALDLAEDSFHSIPNPQFPAQNPNFLSPDSDFDSAGASRQWIRVRMQECAKDGNLMESLDFLRLLVPTVLDYNAVLHCYFKSGCVSLDEVVNVFNGLKRFGPRPNVWTFNILINGLCRLGYLDDACEVVDEMCGHAFVPSFTLLKSLLSKAVRSGSLELSVYMIELMLKFDYMPSVSVVSNLILNFNRVGRIVEAYRIFSLLLGKGFIPDTYTSNLILSGLCKSSQCWRALSMFYALIKKGFSQDVYSYTTLVLGFSQERRWEEAYRILKQMRKEGQMPNVVTYTVLIKFLCKDNKIKEAFRIFHAMQKEGCNPDTITCNVLLHALFSCNMTAKAHDFVQFMESKGYLPDQVTICAIASSMIKAGFTIQAAHLMQKLFFMDDISIDTVSWNIYFHSLCCNGNLGEVLGGLESMMNKGFIPTVVTYNIIINELCKKQYTDEALEVLDHIAWRKGPGPDMLSFNPLLSAACNKGDSSTIQRVINRMEIEGLDFDVVSMTCLLQYFGKTGKISKCVNLFKYMILYGHRPTVITLNVFLDNLCKKGLLEYAKRIFSEFKNEVTFPDTTSYNILIHASISKGAYASVKGLLMDMFSSGLVPDAITFGSLCHGLCKNDDIKAAMHLERWMLEFEVKPNISYYNNLLDAALRMSRFWDAFLILSKMEIEGVEPDAISHKFFKRKMQKGGRIRFEKTMKILEILMNIEESSL